MQADFLNRNAVSRNLAATLILASGPLMDIIPAHFFDGIDNIWSKVDVFKTKPASRKRSAKLIEEESFILIGESEDGVTSWNGEKCCADGVTWLVGGDETVVVLRRF